MFKRSTLFFACVAIATGMALFHIKYQVVALEQEHKQTASRIKETHESIHVLKAEWTHLNDPRRLQTLAQKHLNIGPIKSTQFISLKLLAPSDGAYDKFALDQLIAEVADVAMGDH
ncbi:MAG: hypothetical protein K2X98_01855 [Alphaproteobacteria bacterium]|nr:hypothetical protein [Alphaproteobacteria bacterium]